MTFQRWYYFLSIERDFIKTIDFVELDPANAKAFSNEYAKLLLLVGSEVDVVAKLLCANVAAGHKPENIDEYRKLIVAKFNLFHTIEIDITRYSMSVRPWQTWDPSIATSPDWWKAYNKVKHEREKNFPEANQKNTIDALSGLLALLLYLYRGEAHLQPYPELLDYGFPSFLVTQGGKKLPST